MAVKYEGVGVALKEVGAGGALQEVGVGEAVKEVGVLAFHLDFLHDEVVSYHDTCLVRGSGKLSCNLSFTLNH